jgi:hypothetical protein
LSVSKAHAFFLAHLDAFRKWFPYDTFQKPIFTPLLGGWIMRPSELPEVVEVFLSLMHQTIEEAKLLIQEMNEINKSLNDIRGQNPDRVQ